MSARTYNCNKIVTGISCNLSLGLSDSLTLLRFVEEKLDSIKWTALLDGILSPCLNNAINHCNSNMWRGKRRGGGGVGASSGFKPPCYKLLHKLSRDSSRHKNPFQSNNKYMRIQAVLTIDKQL